MLLSAMLDASKSTLKLLNSGIEVQLDRNSRLPIPVRSPPPEKRGAVSLYVTAMDCNAAPDAVPLSSRVSRLTLSMGDAPALVEAGLSQGEVMEAEAHRLRIRGVLESSPDLLKAACAKYMEALALVPGPAVGESLLRAITDGLRVAVEDGSERVDHASPSLHRHVSHCFAGMALCHLMGAGSLQSFFSLTSSALVWERDAPLQLVTFLRLHLAVMCQQAPTLWHSPVVEGFCKRLVRPVVVAERNQALLELERPLMTRVEWDWITGAAERREIQHVRNIADRALAAKDPLLSLVMGSRKTPKGSKNRK